MNIHDTLWRWYVINEDDKLGNKRKLTAPSFLFSMITLAADLLITCTTYSGHFTCREIIYILNMFGSVIMPVLESWQNIYGCVGFAWFAMTHARRVAVASTSSGLEQPIKSNKGTLLNLMKIMTLSMLHGVCEIECRTTLTLGEFHRWLVNLITLILGDL